MHTGGAERWLHSFLTPILNGFTAGKKILVLIDGKRRKKT
jgi:hypothetical protein